MLEHLLDDIAKTGDLALYGIASDWLEEQGRRAEAELVRLTWLERRPEVEVRIQQLLVEGVEPCLPRRVNSLGMEFVWLPPGKFLMGTPELWFFRSEPEEAQQEVELSQGFWIGIHPVTNEQYQELLGVTPSYFSPTGAGRTQIAGLDWLKFPAERVSWEAAREFCTALAEREDGPRYSLPTEAQWEYACRAGETEYSEFHFGEIASAHQANFDFSDITLVDGEEPFGVGHPTPVGSYLPNAWGLYDMHGNVHEWCLDWFGYAATQNPLVAPRGPTLGDRRVQRGGSWSTTTLGGRSAARSHSATEGGNNDEGFRIVCLADPNPTG